RSVSVTFCRCLPHSLGTGVRVRRRGRPCPVSPVALRRDPAAAQLYTLSLHDALPIYGFRCCHLKNIWTAPLPPETEQSKCKRSRSEDGSAGMPRPISYAVFCLKKKKQGVRCRPEAATCDLQPTP